LARAVELVFRRSIIVSDSPNITLVKEYFARGDAGRADLLDLFDEKVEFYFPKFGVGRGKAAFGEFVQGFLTAIRQIAHPMEGLQFWEVGDMVFVEGMTQGETVSGERWKGGETPGGRFASVIEVKNNLITRMNIYLDPDYVSADADRFLWGRDRSW
jgi:ketosteroid isomerase-like protein